MAATNNRIQYQASASFTMTIASLATSSTLVAGRESASLDNTTNDDFDHLISGQITTGTSPTAGGIIEVWAVARLDDSVWPDVFDGTESAETVTSHDILAGQARLVYAIAVSATSNVAYTFSNVSVRSLFGEMPGVYDLFLVHSTGVNLNSTGGNHFLTYKRVASTSGG